MRTEIIPVDLIRIIPAEEAMKYFNSIVAGTMMLASITGCKKADNQADTVSNERQKEVVVYTYDSFAAEWGAAPILAEKFKEKTGLTVTFVDCGDAAQALSKAILEKDNPNADVLMGPDNNLAEKARASGVLVPYKPTGADTIIAKEQEDSLGGDWLLTPYDYSHFALIYDTSSKVPAPGSLEDLTRPEYKRNLILMDPRTSTLGLGFVAWTVARFGDSYADYWKALKPSILTMAPGWTAGYGAFTNGEAPLVISYTTSPAYHYEEDKSTRFKALVFAEGHVQQTEGAGIIKGAKNEVGAKMFLDFLISKDAQNALPLTQWMYPVNNDAEIPESYKIAAPIPGTTLSVSSASLKDAVETVMNILSEK